MAKIQIDGKIFEVKTDKSLLETCLALGFDIPYFCFHHAMGSVGACRQCAVKKFANPQDTKGRIVMSCMEPVTDGLIISIKDPEAVAFREAVLEGLMTNHPHDCPVCDEGGECHLQDMTVLTGHAYRRFVFKKRTHNNQYLGPFIQHEMNRCIQCYRCLRFYTDYAGGTDFCVSGSANRVYFGRHEEGILENEFSGNLVEVCPTGVFTDKTLRAHYTRKWDLTNSPSVCVHCSIGCNTLVSQRYGSVRRILNRYNRDVNGYFICDRGRFGYEFINSPRRIGKIMTREPEAENGLKEASGDLQSLLSPVLKGKKLTGIGSPRASLESNFALETLVGKQNYYLGISKDDFNLTKVAIDIMKGGYFHPPSLREIEKADVILILGEDPTNSAPMLALAVRQASRNKSFELAGKRGIPRWNDYPVREIGQNLRTPVFIAAPLKTKLDTIAAGLYKASPFEIADMGNEIAHLIDPSAPSPGNKGSRAKETAKLIADTLLKADNPVIITGLHSGLASILYASANISKALASKGKNPSLSIIFPESNTLGTVLMGGGTIDDLLDATGENKGDTLIILENDLYQRADKNKIDRLFQGFSNIVVLDHLVNDTARKADLLLPAGTFAESTGTIVNNEGRAQRYYRVLPEDGQVTDSWKFIIRMADIAGVKAVKEWKCFDDVVNSLVAAYPAFAGIKDRMPDSGFRYYNDKIARQTLRFSGRTAMNAAVKVSEPEPPRDPDSPLKFSMEGYKGVPPAELVPYYWAPGWNSVQATNKYLSAPDSLSNPGVLLFEGNGNVLSGYFTGFSELPKHGTDQILIVPVILIYGSEELSSASKPVTERIPVPFLLMNTKVLKRLNLPDSGMVRISVDGTFIQAEVKKDDDVADGVGGLGIIRPQMNYMRLPALCRVEKSD